MRLLLLALLSAASAPALAQVPTSAAMMRIDPATQRQRDQSRVAILQDELAAEAVALGDAQKQLRTDDVRVDPRRSQEANQRIARHRQNISTLARELVLVERQAGTAKPAAASLTTPPPADQLPPAVATVRERPEDRPRSGAGRSPDWLITANPTGRAP